MVLFAATSIRAAEARVCANSSVSATGSTAYFKYFASKQARTAWSRKVTRNAKLGQAYSRWSLAKDSKMTCRNIADRFRCVAVADPCRDKAAVERQTIRRGAV
jgi:hypothetical protein